MIDDPMVMAWVVVFALAEAVNIVKILIHLWRKK